VQFRGVDFCLANRGGMAMLKWALIFFVISIVAALFGFTGIAAGAASIAKVLFFLFIVLCAVFLALAVFTVDKLR
jgi:uncharacterized membrane protein YtjA (UPF0391 family)